jgi:hypothetical protein
LKAGPTGKLAFLNDMVGIFEAEVDFEGNFWENLGIKVIDSTFFITKRN